MFIEIAAAVNAVEFETSITLDTYGARRCRVEYCDATKNEYLSRGAELKSIDGAYPYSYKIAAIIDGVEVYDYLTLEQMIVAFSDMQVWDRDQRLRAKCCEACEWDICEDKNNGGCDEINKAPKQRKSGER